ncbi:ankyrin repeat domain-containing protein [Caulobacter sp. ErkDOM-E]|uniref:ankyrin repeat domain-containing protein n=1 Tax=Caulobacter sp. ErkDOM-E TaxID=3402778 RepID=UPI003AF5D13C
MKKDSLVIAGFALAMLAFSSPVNCMEYRVGGRTASEDFRRPEDAKLALASCNGDVTAIARAISIGANPNAIGATAGTPLFWALSCKSLPGMEALLKAGSSPNYQIPGDGDAFSPVFVAAGLEDPRMLQLLLKYGGDPSSTGDSGHTSALERAFGLGLQLSDGGLQSERLGWENYYLLLEAGADINQRGVSFSIAEVAASLNQFDKVSELLDRGYVLRLENLRALIDSTRTEFTGINQGAWLLKVKAKLEGVGTASVSSMRR